jgi:hypothetical protein
MDMEHGVVEVRVGIGTSPCAQQAFTALAAKKRDVLHKMGNTLQ